MSEEGKIDFYSYIEAEERAAMSWSDRIFNNTATIRTTREVAEGFTGKKPFAAHQKFYPKRWNRYTLLIFMAFLAYGFLRSLIEGKTPFWVLLIWGALILFISAGGYWIATSKEMNFTISLSHIKLQVGDLLLDWDDVEETYLVERPEGKSNTSFLIICLKDGSLHRYELTNLHSWNPITEKLSAALEHYRARYTERANCPVA